MVVRGYVGGIDPCGKSFPLKNLLYYPDGTLTDKKSYPCIGRRSACYRRPLPVLSGPLTPLTDRRLQVNQTHGKARITRTGRS